MDPQQVLEEALGVYLGHLRSNANIRTRVGRVLDVFIDGLAKETHRYHRSAKGDVDMSYAKSKKYILRAILDHITRDDESDDEDKMDTDTVQKPAASQDVEKPVPSDGIQEAPPVDAADKPTPDVEKPALGDDGDAKDKSKDGQKGVDGSSKEKDGGKNDEEGEDEGEDEEDGQDGDEEDMDWESGGNGSDESYESDGGNDDDDE